MIKFIEDRYATERGLVRLMLARLEFVLGRLNRFTMIDFEKVERLVFVCQGNICRSPFAEFIAREAGVESSGFGLATSKGLPAFERAQQTAIKFGVDMDSHRTRRVEDFDIRATDLLVGMEVRHARRLQLIAESHHAQVTLLGHWAEPKRLHIHDPFEHTESYFENCYQVIQSGTENLVKALKSKTELESKPVQAN